ncbi:helix-turn-helix transcriptional regulator [Paenibacillus woosongensis]|uniref:Transcriptional regulator n=1 Tax=Paenibacillus woosongensis TaxID=307580 RepID=A0AA95L2M2_9BACL|nr:helix-turn-helix transcriptional regulator [Paenibacillus woosongensis]WHX49947.1 helix-turn-helix transcriptional regulator [Paenibacillus woosongensis]GIP60538.1 transcriptional regulator [Paenibacillus woosongensis]
MKNNIYLKRKELDMSQLELAEKVNVTRQTINAVENNKYDPSLKLAMNIAKVLKVSVEELFFE